METIHLKVSGMTCRSCVKHVEKAINAIAGVHKVAVILETGTAIVEGEFAQGATPILAALEEDGYPSVVIMDIQGDKESNSSSCKSGGSCCCH